MPVASVCSTTWLDVRSLKDFHWDFPSVSRLDTWDALVTAGWILELDAYRGVENGVVHSNRGIVGGAPVFRWDAAPEDYLPDKVASGEAVNAAKRVIDDRPVGNRIVFDYL